MKIIVATGNADKMKEIREIMGPSGYDIRSQKEEGLTCDAEENGSTFAENALIKARNISGKLGQGEKAVVLADDSGLVIDALGGEPGIYSARYMGEDTSYHVKNAELIRRLTGVPYEKRTARFVCAVAAVLPDGREITAEGTIEGRIGYEERGENGFGYDPIFYLPDMSRSTAELAREEKNAIRHRGNAFRAMKEKLEKIYGV